MPSEITEDPLGLVGGLNSYLYVNASPLRFTDPTGELVWFAAPIIGGIIGGSIDLAWQLWQSGGNWECVSWGSVLGSAALGAAFSSLGPSGVFFGRARNGMKGFMNSGDYARLGWSYKKSTGRQWFSWRPGTPGNPHYDMIPGPRQGGAELGFGVGGGIAGGVLGADCGCQL